MRQNLSEPRLAASETKEYLESVGKLRKRNGEVFEDGAFGKENNKWTSYQGCRFINQDFSKASFIECDFRWAIFENCKGIKFEEPPMAKVGTVVGTLSKLICNSPNFIDCDFSEAILIENKKDQK